MASKKKPSTVEIATKLMEPIVEELGLTLWDVRFEKEGTQWYLRFFIDKEGGVTIQDCEQASRAVDIKLDEVDPIPQQYILEVGSPGVERRLVKDWHFQEYLGQPVHIRFYKAYEGSRDYYGTLLRKEGDEIAIQLDEEQELAFNIKEAAFVELAADF